jgi:hypothetical protein
VALKSCAPFSIRSHLIASRTYDVRGILIGLADVVADMNCLEEVCEMFAMHHLYHVNTQVFVDNVTVRQ